MIWWLNRTFGRLIERFLGQWLVTHRWMTSFITKTAVSNTGLRIHIGELESDLIDMRDRIKALEDTVKLVALRVTKHDLIVLPSERSNG